MQSHRAFLILQNTFAGVFFQFFSFISIRKPASSSLPNQLRRGRKFSTSCAGKSLKLHGLLQFRISNGYCAVICDKLFHFQSSNLERNFSIVDWIKMTEAGPEWTSSDRRNVNISSSRIIIRCELVCANEQSMCEACTASRQTAAEKSPNE